MPVEATQPSVSKREKDMEYLLQKRKEENEGELEGADEETKKKLEEEEAAKVVGDEELLIFTNDKGDKFEVPKSASTTLKIDGEEVITPADKIVSRYQKGAAGDSRLQAANDLKKDLDKKAEDLSAREKNFLDQAEKAKQQNLDGKLSSDDYKIKVKELISAVVDADEGKAIELFSSIYQPPVQTGTIDEAALTTKFVKLLDARESKTAQKTLQKSVDKANLEFEKDYPELNNDPKLYTLVDAETARIAVEKPNATPGEIIVEAAKNIQKWYGTKKPGEKLKKKSAPTPAGGKVPLGEAPKKETREDIINDLRKSRGQPAL